MRCRRPDARGRGRERWTVTRGRVGQVGLAGRVGRSVRQRPTWLTRPTSPTRPAGSAQPLVDFVPVHDVPPRVDVVGPPILILQVVRVFPHVDPEDRLLAVHYRVVLIGRALDRDL